MRIVFLGPPGSGKGTQSSRLSKKFGIPQLSTGDIFRTEVGKNTDIGQQIKSMMETGRLISDSIVNKVVYNRIRYSSDCAHGFILDGYPRTVDQARFLQHFLSNLGFCIDAVIELSVDDVAMFKRIDDRISRSMSSKESIRSDDKHDVLLKRIEDYREKICLLSEYYRDIGCLYTVDGMLDVETVSKYIDSVLVAVEKKCCNS
ncbi:MAG: adenylate kinase [Candidatus Liberibacter ctenarytainae]|uniref:Adenylate kinase n=1 Tax=Candidatus Liberibacter ctenarytainae TaxID=2020335 RepID=A0A937AD97_9HYPH|nr:adenylate kinase [Candidatus Liberibacter ctenarytainae]